MKDRKPYFRGYFAAHREEMNARSRRQRRENPDKVREQGRRRRERARVLAVSEEASNKSAAVEHWITPTHFQDV